MVFKLCHNLLQDMQSMCSGKWKFCRHSASTDINSKLICMVSWLSGTRYHLARNYPHLWHARVNYWGQNIPSWVKNFTLRSTPMTFRISLFDHNHDILLSRPQRKPSYHTDITSWQNQNYCFTRTHLYRDRQANLDTYEAF